MYKAFAAVTLVAAPLVVLAVQSFVPQTNHTAAPVVAPFPMAASSSQPMPQPILPTVRPAPPVSEGVAPSAPFGQPMAEAGKPFLAPGTGLPAAAPTPAPAMPPQQFGPAPSLNEPAR